MPHRSAYACLPAGLCSPSACVAVRLGTSFVLRSRVASPRPPPHLTRATATAPSSAAAPRAHVARWHPPHLAPRTVRDRPHVRGFTGIGRAGSGACQSDGGRASTAKPSTIFIFIHVPPRHTRPPHTVRHALPSACVPLMLISRRCDAMPGSVSRSRRRPRPGQSTETSTFFCPISPGYQPLPHAPYRVQH